MSGENLEVWMTSGGLNHIPQQDVPAEVQYDVEQDVPAVQKLPNTFLLFFPYTALTILATNKTISDGGITVDFWFIKVHTSN